jgi:hypothetical protein
MRHLLRLATALLFVVTLPGCAARMTVGSHVERGLDLSPYRTFDWGPADALPAGDARLARNPHFNDYVLGAVERGLSEKGLILTSAEPDLLIHYHANISTRINVSHTDREYGYCLPPDCHAETMQYEVGTLVLDVIDADTNRLIWRGWAQTNAGDMLREPDSMATTIEQAVARMLLRLPPTFQR